MSEGFWEKARLGAFINTLPKDLSRADEAVSKLLRNSPTLRHECRRPLLLSDPHERLTAGEFVCRLFGFSPDWLRENESNDDVEKLKAILSEAETALLRHFLVSVSPGGTQTLSSIVRLRCSHVVGDCKLWRNGRLTPLSKCRFAATAFLKELKAAGVPESLYKHRPEKAEQILNIYENLPEVVKDLFFSVSMDGDLNRDFPCYLARDLLLFVDNQRWAEIKQACESGDKKKFNEIIRRFLGEFLTFQRQQNGFRLGMVRGTEDNITTREFTIREKAYLDFFRPGKWIGRTKQYTSVSNEALEMNSSE